MGKLAFIFPGQGAQYIGMGKDFYKEFPICRQTIEKAAEISKLDLEKICFEENEKISITEYTQIAMTAVEAAILKALEEKGFYSDMTAGLSLGEYGALLASGAMPLEDIFYTVRKRGIYMQEAVPKGGAMAAVLGMEAELIEMALLASGAMPLEDIFYTVRKRGIYMQEAVPKGGAMAAVLGMEAELIEMICEETQGIVSVANYNCPGQIVITGEEAAVAKASEKLKEAGAKRILPLQVSGPFHCEMLTGAGEKLSKVLEEIPLREIKIPYVSNVTAQMVTEKEEIKKLLVKQVSSPVRWQQCVETMIENGADTFVEIGPGRTLSGFMRKINRNVTVMNIQTVEDFWKVTEKLEERRENSVGK